MKKQVLSLVMLTSSAFAAGSELESRGSAELVNLAAFKNVANDMRATGKESENGAPVPAGFGQWFSFEKPAVAGQGPALNGLIANAQTGKAGRQDFLVAAWTFLNNRLLIELQELEARLNKGSLDAADYNWAAKALLDDNSITERLRNFKSLSNSTMLAIIRLALAELQKQPVVVNGTQISSEQITALEERIFNGLDNVVALAKRESVQSKMVGENNDQPNPFARVINDSASSGMQEVAIAVAKKVVKAFVPQHEVIVGKFKSSNPVELIEALRALLAAFQEVAKQLSRDAAHERIKEPKVAAVQDSYDPGL
jgi:hypothetical protein